MTADEIDAMERRIAQNVYREHGVILAGISIYAMNTKNEEVKALRSEITHRIMSHDGVLQIHGFYVDTEAKEMQFDVVMSFDILPREGLKTLYEEMRRAYPDYKITIAPDVDVSVTE